MIALFNRKNRIAVDTQRFLTSSVLANFINFIKSIITARLLGPYWIGICLSLMTIPQTANYFNFGLTETLQVEVPRIRQKDDQAEEKISGLKNILLNYSVITSIGLFILVLCYSLLFSSNNLKFNLLILFAGSLIVLEQIRKFFYTDYVAEKQFTKLSWLEFILAGMTLVLSVLAIIFFDVYGYWIGIIIPYIGFILYSLNDYRKKHVIKFEKIKPRDIWNLLPLGVVMVLSSVVYTPFMIVAKLFIAFALGPKEVGLFMLSIILIAKIAMIPRAISSALIPHMSSLGLAEKRSMRTLFAKAQLYTFLLSLLSVVVGYFLLEPAVKLFLPEYLTGVPSAKIFLFACIPYCLLDNANTILILSKDKRSYLKILGIVFLVQFFILGFIYYADLSISNVALSYFFIFTLYALLAHGRIFKLLAP